MKPRLENLLKQQQSSLFHFVLQTKHVFLYANQKYLQCFFKIFVPDIFVEDKLHKYEMQQWDNSAYDNE